MVITGKISAYYAVPHPPIIVPAVGKGEEVAIKDTAEAFDKVAAEIESIEPDVIILITPHGPLFQDAISLSYDEKISGSLSRFGARSEAYNADIDLPLTKRIISLAEEELGGLSTVQITKSSSKQFGVEYELDHGTMVPLHFINKRYKSYKLVHITYGLLPKLQLYKFGMLITKAVEESGKNVVMIASGDLSHRLTKDGPYEYSPCGEVFDTEIISLLSDGDVMGIFNMDPGIIEEAGECALRSYYVLLGAMNAYEFKGRKLSYQGNFGVGYLVMSFDINKTGRNTFSQLQQQQEDKYQLRLKGEDPYMSLARESLAHYVTHGKHLNKIPSYVTDEMNKLKRGVFVSISIEGELRGCIGTIQPTKDSIAKEIIWNAVEAGMFDPRFPPVEEDELKPLEFSVDVLAEPEKAVKSDLDTTKYGVIVRSGYKSGLLLPNLEGVDTVEEQLDIALKKAGISPNSSYSIERFEVIRHKGENSDS